MIGRGKTRIIALENEKIKANFIPGAGVLHDLVLKETNTDVLVRGEYPYGFVLYGWGGWGEVSRNSEGKRAVLTFASKSPDGNTVTMKASLESGDDFVRMEYDFGDVLAVRQSYYLMSRISLDGSNDVMIIPKKGGEQLRPWRQVAFLAIKADELAVNSLMVHDRETKVFFAVGFHAPGFSNLQVSSGANGFNYMLFHPVPNVAPGKAVFLLGAGKGDITQARALGERLARLAQASAGK